MGIGAIYVKEGKFDEGIQACKTAVGLGERNAQLSSLLCCAYAAAGKLAEARKHLAEMQGLAQKAYVQPFCFACIYSALGEIDEALVWLEKAVDEHAPVTLHAHINPITIPLRSHPRYHALIGTPMAH